MCLRAKPVLPDPYFYPQTAPLNIGGAIVIKSELIVRSASVRNSSIALKGSWDLNLFSEKNKLFPLVKWTIFCFHRKLNESINIFSSSWQCKMNCHAT